MHTVDWITKKFPSWNPCQLTMIFKTGIWLAGSTAASQSKAMLENPY